MSYPSMEKRTEFKYWFVATWDNCSSEVCLLLIWAVVNSELVRLDPDPRCKCRMSWSVDVLAVAGLGWNFMTCWNNHRDLCLCPHLLHWSSCSQVVPNLFFPACGPFGVPHIKSNSNYLETRSTFSCIVTTLRSKFHSKNCIMLTLFLLKY